MCDNLLPETNLGEDELGRKVHNKLSSKGSNCRSNLEPYLCVTCGKAFRSKDTLLRHRMSHSGAKPFSCDVCKMGLSSAVSLKEHKAMHDEQKLYECSICHRCFRQNSSYRRHLTTHLKTSPHECSLCKRRFAQRAYLRSHMKMHTGEKPYLCDPPCTKSFAHLSDLKRHRVLHTGKRPYKCDICGSSFADRSSRKRHQKDHGNKPWKHTCQICKTSFKRATQLEKHMTKAHGIASLLCLGNAENLKNSVKDNCLPLQICESDVNVTTLQIFSNGKGVSHTELLPTDSLSTKESDTQFRNCSDTSSLHTEKTNDLCHLSEFQGKDRTEPLKNCKQDVSEMTSALPVYQKNILPSVDYVVSPDFSSQEYFDWLTNFVSLCKRLPLPIENEVFGKINQVHKSVIDCLSNPSELVCSRMNFKATSNLSQDLLGIMNKHLNFVFSQLPH